MLQSSFVAAVNFCVFAGTSRFSKEVSVFLESKLGESHIPKLYRVSESPRESQDGSTKKPSNGNYAVYSKNGDCTVSKCRDTFSKTFNLLYRRSISTASVLYPNVMNKQENENSTTSPTTGSSFPTCES